MTMTTKELKAAAKDLGIKGYTKMSKDQLAEAVQAATQPEEETTAERVKRIKRKTSTAERDSDGKVIRTGRNLSGNTPWRRKYYSLMTGQIDEAALEAAPNQVRLIVRAMREAGYVDGEDMALGKEIVDYAKEAGILKTKIESANLFAYYRRVLEQIGVAHVE